MTGPIVNALAILVCSLVGVFLIKGIPQRLEEIIKKAAGLAIIFIGIKGALDNENVLLLIISMVIGAFLGELIDIDKWINALGIFAEKKLKMASPPGSTKSFSKGFVTASILFCTGSMAIVGSLQSGLSQNHEVLFAKSILDGTMSIVFGASFGIGTAFSAIVVLLYQGGIVLCSMAISDVLSADMIREMSAVGSLVVAAIGFNFLEVKPIKVANLIPAIFIPCVYLFFVGLF